MDNTWAKRRAYPADPHLRSQLRAVVEGHGLEAAAEALSMAPATLARLVAGGAVLDGTIELARTRLRDYTQSSPVPPRAAAAANRPPEHVREVIARVIAGLDPTDES